MAKIKSLTKVADFNTLLSKGRVWRGNFLDIRVLFLAKKSDLSTGKNVVDNLDFSLKLAFAVGLKVSKKAIIRNRVKRQLREVARHLLAHHESLPAAFVLLVARPIIKEKNFAEISQEVQLLLARARII